MRILDCFRIGRPTRAFSNTIEMKQKYHIEVGKIREEKEGKKINVFSRFDWINSIGRDPLYLGYPYI